MNDGSCGKLKPSHVAIVHITFKVSRERAVIGQADALPKYRVVAKRANYHLSILLILIPNDISIKASRCIR